MDCWHCGNELIWGGDDDVMNFGPAGGNWGALTFGTHQSDEKE